MDPLLGAPENMYRMRSLLSEELDEFVEDGAKPAKISASVSVDAFNLEMFTLFTASSAFSGSLSPHLSFGVITSVSSADPSHSPAFLSLGHLVRG